MTNTEYTIEVEVRGDKRDVYLVISEHERRHIFSISLLLLNNGRIRFLLRHVKKEKLGTLTDEIGMIEFQRRISLMYHKLNEETTCAGKFLLTMETDESKDSILVRQE